MKNFTFSLPTVVHFGEGQVQTLPQTIRLHGSRVLLVYGGGSIKRSGLYATITGLLQENGIFFQELPGVQPNPRVTSVRAGVALCREHQLDFVLAVGGGSIIDCAKVIAAAVYYEGDPWDFCLRKAQISDALPLGSVLTLAATGSEMNSGAVISNEETDEKLPVMHKAMLPKFAILDPAQTFSVPASQTAAGTADIMSHVLEQYFGPVNDAFLADRMSEAVLKTCIHYGPIAVREPDNYAARANLMWASSLGLNGLLQTGKTPGDWATHMIEHEVSAIYDITHGLGLAILTPFWMEHVLNGENMGRFAQYARNVWAISESDDLKAAKAGILATAAFFRSLGLAGSLKECGVAADRLEEMAEKAVRFGMLGALKKLDKDAVLQILTAAF
ncbi:iron-containing alcohol dehydrogenase [Azotosporobacter soli]|uniref:iron-containing alcohol dehydrogenase n=1 Tax=Azotosporobacter soli TaxID=3055040 RepID=UPI0031FEFEEF